MSTSFLKNLRRLFDKYAIASTEHDALVKSTTKIFSNFVAFSENPNFNTATNCQIKLDQIADSLVKLQIKIGVHFINVELSQLLTLGNSFILTHSHLCVAEKL